MFKRKLGTREGVFFYARFLPDNLHLPKITLLNLQNDPHFTEKLLGKNKLICYNIERVNIFCVAAGQQR